MQFFVVSVFSWMFVEVVQMYLVFVRHWRPKRLKLSYISSFGWGFPVAVVTITISVHFGMLNASTTVPPSATRLYPEYNEVQM